MRQHLLTTSPRCCPLMPRTEGKEHQVLYTNDSLIHFAQKSPITKNLQNCSHSKLMNENVSCNNKLLSRLLRRQMATLVDNYIHQFPHSILPCSIGNNPRGTARHRPATFNRRICPSGIRIQQHHAFQGEHCVPPQRASLHGSFHTVALVSKPPC